MQELKKPRERQFYVDENLFNNNLNSGHYNFDNTLSLYDPLSESEKAIYRRFYEENKFDASKLPPEHDSILWLNGQEVGARGNIIAVTGKAKSRKTAVAGGLMTSLFLPEAEFLGFSSNITENDKVLHFDTEQGYKHYYHTVKSTYENAKYKRMPENFISLRTRQAAIPFRIKCIQFLLEEHKPAVMVIDGVTDLVYNLNDQKEASIVGGLLASLSEIYNCLMVCVIHTTKSTGYMTGAVGTYLEKKAMTVIKVEKDEKNKDVSHISCQYAREKDFTEFSIMFNDTKGHYEKVEGVEKPKKATPKQPDYYADDDHYKVLEKVYLLGTEAFEYGQLWKKIQKVIAEMFEVKIGDNNAKTFAKYYLDNTLIFKHPETKLYLKIPAPGNVPF